jgi:cytochrome c5
VLLPLKTLIKGNSIIKEGHIRMKKLLTGFMVIMFIFAVQTAYAGSEKISHNDLFQKKCTTCHKADLAKKLHLPKKDFLRIIKKMQKKKNTKIADREAEKIADFLSSPNRTLFEKKCTSCHGIGYIERAHKANRMTRDTIIRMKKKGADISEDEINSIYDFINNYQFVPPMPAVNPVY